jgi:hypothetical protein
VLVGLVGALVAVVTAVAPLPSGTDVDYQLGGAVDAPAHVGIVVRDREAAPQAGRYNVCYVNGFQAQRSELTFWRRHPALLLHDPDGQLVIDQDWGEPLLDFSTSAKRGRLTAIINRWVSDCAADGYQAVEFDNLDSFTRSHGLLTRKQAVQYAALLVAYAHIVGLAAGQKNLAGFDGRTIGYDFAISEECGRYHECQRYVRHYGDAVLMIEYRGRDFAATCAAYGATHAVELRDVDLTPSGVHRWC